MSAKRPDQYRLDPDEAGATDYKFRPDTPNEAELEREDADERLYDRALTGRDTPDVPRPEDGSSRSDAEVADD